MNHASLFSGIGGFDLAAEWMGWNNVFSCENDTFCQKVLQYHFPNTTHYGDIKQFDGTKYRGEIDIITGGFPCQPFSAAGKRRGTADDRFLWPEMLRVIREIQPTWVIAENVRGITTQGEGLVFERVCAEMEENGFEVQPFCIPACAVDAPHRRERIWFLARSHTNQERRGDGCDHREERHLQNDERLTEEDQPERKGRERGAGEIDQTIANAECERHERTINQEGSDARHYSWLRPWCENWVKAATRLCRLDDGLSRELDGITIPKWRNESIKAYGNAIVPQVAYMIFQSISHAQK